MSYKKAPKRIIENHRTAAWANIEKENEISKLSHPSLQQTIEAKEYVDDNAK
jgi:hypothetical protein